MAKEFSRSFYKSKIWQQCRDGYILSVNGMCERCLIEGKHIPGWIVHHKTWLTPTNINNPEISLNWNNLEYVCQDCHNKEHMGKYASVADGLMFDNNGELVVGIPPIR